MISPSSTPAASLTSYSFTAVQHDGALYPHACDAHPTESPPFMSSNVNINSMLLSSEKLSTIMLADVEGQQQQLTTKAQQTIRRSIDHPGTLVSPMQRCPMDILIEIFKHCLDDETASLLPRDEGFITPFHVQTVSCILSYVCRSWRLLLLSTPLLWPQQLGLYIPGGTSAHLPHPPPRGALDLLKLYLDRSHPLPLRIALHCNHTLYTNNRGTHSMYWGWNPVDICSELFRHSERFKSLCISLNSTLAIPCDPSPGMVVAFPELQSLSVAHSQSLPPWLERALKTTPKLCEFHATSSILSTKATPPAISPEIHLLFTSQLTRLRLGSVFDPITHLHALSTLSLTPNLEECILVTTSTELPSSTLPPQVVLPRLKLFHWNDSSRLSGDEVEFISRLSLPSLQDLSLLTCSRPSHVPHIIRDSRSTITSLTLDLDETPEMQLDSDVDDLLAVFEELIALEKLEIMSAMPHRLLRALATNEGAPLCPRLQRLKFTSFTVADTSDGTWEAGLALITDVVRSRAQSIDTAAILSELELDVRTFGSELPRLPQDLAGDLRSAAQLGGCAIGITVDRRDFTAGSGERCRFCMDALQWVTIQTFNLPAFNAMCMYFVVV